MQRKWNVKAGAASIVLTGASGFAATSINTQYSSNWAGDYATAPSGESFTDISSTWVIPTLLASSTTSYAAEWVGFDGVSDTTVEQCGVASEITSGGSTNYFAWYEFAPAASVEVGLSVAPGNTMFAEVTYEPSESSAGQYAYFFDLKNETTGKSFSTTIDTSSNDARNSAEWIAEAPTVNNQQSTLANFGSVTFTNDVAALNGESDSALGSLNYNTFDMEQNSTVVGVPTPLSSAGEDFSVNYKGVYPTLTWNNSGGDTPSNGTTWDIGANNNWNNGSHAAVYADGSTVTFNDSNNGHYSVALNTTVSPSSVTVNNSGGDYTITGSGSIAGAGSLTKSGTRTLTLDTVNTYSGSTTVTAGKLIVGTNGALPDAAVSITGGTLQLGSGTGLAQVKSLAISGSGDLDITNNNLIINYGGGGDPIASVKQWIKTGYASGAWNGSGIISSTAQSNSASYGIGYADSADSGNPAGLAAGQIEIKYTLLGDANLDGTVNSIDFAILAANFNQSVSGWDQGDFNYDGTVNSVDFADLAANFNQAASQSADIAALESFASANGLLADVPEPASAAMIMIAGLGFLRRRRRHPR